jgi:hypothetical protein
MGKTPNKNKVQREMKERYGREVHEVSVDWSEKRARKHKGSWLEDQDPEDSEESEND